MRHMVIVATACLFLISLPVVVSAERVSLALTDVTAITNGEGGGHLLFRIDDETLPASLAISRAILTVPLAGESATRRLDLRVFGVSRNWSPGGASWNDGWDRGEGGLHDRLYAESELDLRGQVTVVTFDITSLLKYEKEEDVAIRGFLLTARGPNGNGIPAADMARFSRLSNATVEVSYRRLPPGASRLSRATKAGRQPVKLDTDRPGR